MRQFVLLMAGAVVCVSIFAAEIRVVEEIVAKVNGDIITKGELDRNRRTLEQELKAQAGASAANVSAGVQEREKDLLRERIDQLLLVQKGKELNLNVDQEVSRQLADIRVRSKITDDQKFADYVREQTGQSLEDYKQDMKNSLLTRRVIGQEVARLVTVPKEETKKFYETNKDKFVREDAVYVREILISTEGKDAKTKAASEKKAKDLAARARRGEKFTDLARDNSDSQTAQEGGALPAFKKGDLDKRLEDLVFTKEKGYVTDPVALPNGFLILKVEEHTKPGLMSFEEAEPMITNQLFEPRMQPEVRKYLLKLRQQAFLEIKPGYVDTGAAPGKNTAWTDPAQLRPETITKEEVANKKRRRRLLGMVPVPGTSTSSGPKTVVPAAGTSTSKPLGPK